MSFGSQVFPMFLCLKRAGAIQLLPHQWDSEGQEKDWVQTLQSLMIFVQAEGWASALTMWQPAQPKINNQAKKENDDYDVDQINPVFY